MAAEGSAKDSVSNLQTQPSPRAAVSNRFLTDTSQQQNTVAVILNWTLPLCTSRLFSSACLRVCVDGGANRLYDELPQRHKDAEPDALREAHLPEAIIGDMDSARDEVVEFYRQRGADVFNLADDQDSTDLQKCVMYLEQRFGLEQLQHMTIVALGGLGGRLDHTLSNLNCLYMYPHLQLVLLGDGSTARLLPAGRSTVRTDRSIEGPTCGLIPLSGSAVATSTGLKWNLSDTEMKFGGLISSCNVIAEDDVRVQTSLPLVWTTEFKDSL